MLTFVKTYPKIFLDQDLFKELVVQATITGDLNFILNILKNFPYRVYPETFLDPKKFQAILLEAAVAGNAYFILNILKNFPYRAHPKTIKNIFKQAGRRHYKRNRDQKVIYRQTQIWLNTYATLQPARRWVDPDNIIEFDMSGFSLV